MPRSVSLIYETLENGRFHVFTSPDVPGRQASGDTRDEARKSAIEILSVLAAREGEPLPTITFQDRAARKAA